MADKWLFKSFKGLINAFNGSAKISNGFGKCLNSRPNTSISHIKDNLSRVTHKSIRNILQHMIDKENSIQFPKIISKRHIMLTLCPTAVTVTQRAKIVAFEIAAEVLKGHQNIFGHFQHCSEVF